MTGARRALGWIAVLAAAIFVVLVLTESHPDALIARLIYSSVVTVVTGLIAVAGARLVRRDDWRTLLGTVTVLIAASTFVLLLVLIWKGISRTFNPANGPGVLIAIAFALDRKSVV